MKILQITAGAAGMYCGSCLRDNALAAELIRQGHDITLVPLYTPTLTDEANVSQEKVFFGGISVYLEQNSAIFRHTPWLLDKLWDSKFALKAASKSNIPTNPKFLGEMTVSMLQGEDGRQRKEFGKLMRWAKSQPLPDIVVLPNSMLIGLAGPLKKALGRPVVCTLQGDDLFLEGLQEPYRSTCLKLIREQLRHVDLFVPTSEYYARFMSEYLAIPMERIAIVPLGINLEGYGRAARPAERPFTVGYFARIDPVKGLHILAEGYREFRRLYQGPSRLEAAGWMATEHRAYLDGIERQLAEWGLGGEFNYRGVVDRAEKIRFLQGLDVISVPGHYADPKGIYAIEAMACGVPFVQPDHGAFREMLESSGAGLRVKPGDIASLAAALHRMATEPGLKEELSEHALTAAHEQYAVSKMAVRAVEAYSRCLSPKTSQNTTTLPKARSLSSRT